MTTPDQNPMPEIKVFRRPPVFDGVARAIAKVASLGTETELCLSEHIKHPEPDPRPAANQVVN